MQSGRTTKSFKKQLYDFPSKFKLWIFDYFLCCCTSNNSVSEEEIIPCLDLNKSHESNKPSVSESCTQTTPFLPVKPVLEPNFDREEPIEIASDVSTETVSFQQATFIYQPNISEDTNVKIISDCDSFCTANEFFLSNPDHDFEKGNYSDSGVETLSSDSCIQQNTFDIETRQKKFICES